MKIVVLLSLFMASSAFTVAPLRDTPKPTALNAVTMGNTPNEPGWGTKPKRRTKKSTKPVADHSVNPIERILMKDVILDPDYTLTLAVGLAAPLIAWLHPFFMADGSPSLLGIFGCGLHVLFAAVLGVQTARVRCVFETDGFEFYNIKGPGLDLNNGAKLVQKPRNFETGCLNHWQYEKITNYGFFPSEEFPVICYFKETQTPESQWDQSIAAFDSYGRGQPHFFPGIFSVKQFKEQLKARGAKRKPIPTLKGRMSTK